MDSLIGLLVIAVIAAVFVALVRKSNAKARNAPEARQYKRPEPLTAKQRKALNLPLRPKVAHADIHPVVEPRTNVTRAIRTGWSIGVVAFTYEDSVGVITDRVVTVHSVCPVYLKGECHDQQAERTFRVDRIVGELTDCNTGEIMTPKKWAKHNS